MRNSKRRPRAKRVALITGINGQDGSYLAELLLSREYEVHGTVRSSNIEDPSKLERISHLLKEISLHACSIENHLAVYKLIAKVRPSNCYHLAASSFVSYDFDDETIITSTNFYATHFLLSCILELVPTCRFYFAGSSEMFGAVTVSPQNELTAFNPRSIYGISKLAAYHIVKNYREHHNLFACTGISFNHESPRRGLEYVTRKVTSAAAKIYLGLADSIELGNLEAKRDWGYAPDFINAMWKMLNESKTPTDYVIGTGQLHSVRELLETAFSAVNLDYRKYVRVNKKYFRPAEAKPLLADSAKIRAELGWKPSKTFKTIIEEMVGSDLKLLSSLSAHSHQRLFRRK